MPRTRQRAESGIQSFSMDGTEGCPPTATCSSALSSSLGAAASQGPLVSMGSGLPALPRKMVERIRANEYVDFSELPPAKGKGRPVPQALEGQVIVVQAADLIHNRKIIPDLGTWCQYFALYVAMLAPHHMQTGNMGTAVTARKETSDRLHRPEAVTRTPSIMNYFTDKIYTRYSNNGCFIGGRQRAYKGGGGACMVS